MSQQNPDPALHGLHRQPADGLRRVQRTRLGDSRERGFAVRKGVVLQVHYPRQSGVFYDACIETGKR